MFEKGFKFWMGITAGIVVMVGGFIAIWHFFSDWLVNAYSKFMMKFFKKMADLQDEEDD